MIFEMFSAFHAKIKEFSKKWSTTTTWCVGETDWFSVLGSWAMYGEIEG